MKCQILVSRKSKKIISRCRLLKFLPSMQTVKEWPRVAVYSDVVKSLLLST